MAPNRIPPNERDPIIALIRQTGTQSSDIQIHFNFDSSDRLVKLEVTLIGR